MTIDKVLRYLGIAFIIYAIISGFHFHFSSDDYGSSWSSGYSFKSGVLIVGAILVYLGKRLRDK